MMMKKKNFFFLFFIMLPIFIFSEFFLFLLFFFSELFLILSNFCFQMVDNFFFFSFWNNAQKNTNQCDNMYYNLFSMKNVPMSFLNNMVTDLCFNFSNQPFFFFFALFFFFSSFLVFFFSNFLGLYGVFFVMIMSILFFWLVSLPYMKMIFLDNIYFYVNFGKWMSFSNNMSMKFDFFFDSISFSFLFLTLSMAFSVLVFSFSYFSYEPLVESLMMYLSLFVCSMIFLVSTNNLVNFFLGWELIGLTSFVLMNFWCTKVSTLKAAFKAFSFNKFSDASLLMAIILIFNMTLDIDILSFNSTSSIYNNIFFYFFFFKFNFLDLLSFLFFFSASMKSAQMGMHIWLPDSMEAPVPASALIHSATLVSAGIFIVLSFSNVFDGSYFFLMSMGLLGSMTAFYGGFTAMNQFDTKSMLAYSTISHCGFLMVLAMSNMFEYTIVYLYIHGFFKAAMFMCMGNINRLNKNNQDMSKMGNFFKILPFECMFVSIGLFNLGGLPFSLGFYMKHILIISLKTHFFFFYMIFLNCFFAALTGLYYSFSLMFFIFFDFKKNKNNLFQNINSNNLKSFFKSNSNMGAMIAIFFLFFLSYSMGALILNMYLSKNSIFTENFSMLEFSSIYFFFLNSYNIFFFFSLFNWFILLNFFWLIFTNFSLTPLSMKFYLNIFFSLFLINIMF